LAMQMKNTYFVGRLATYKYYNMDQVVAQALSVFKQIKNNELEDQLPSMASSISPSKNGKQGRSSEES